MMAIGVAWLEAQFLHRAQEMLCQSRRTLMYTYVLAFYLKRNNQVCPWGNIHNGRHATRSWADLKLYAKSWAHGVKGIQIFYTLRLKFALCAHPFCTILL